MPSDPTTQELVVTGHVNENYWGDSFSSYTSFGDRYVTFESDPYVRWVDLDSDGWFDYGARDDGYGHWSYFDGFVWSDKRPVPPDLHEDPQGGLANLFSSEDLVTLPQSFDDPANADGALFAASEWFL